jgi:hypothetical protein
MLEGQRPKVKGKRQKAKGRSNDYSVEGRNCVRRSYFLKIPLIKILLLK